MDLSFDPDGFLMPYTAVTADLESFKETFVGGFPDSATRGGIFNNYQDWLATFRSTVCQTGFYQWIDGSFVTRKNNPNDLDIVTFVDHAVYLEKERNIGAFKSLKFRKETKLDLYFANVYPANHALRKNFEFDSAYWLDLFSKNRLKQHKGFIQIDF